MLCSQKFIVAFVCSLESKLILQMILIVSIQAYKIMAMIILTPMYESPLNITHYCLTFFPQLGKELLGTLKRLEAPRAGSHCHAIHDRCKVT